MKKETDTDFHKPIVVTGVNGGVGSNVLKHLLSKGFKNIYGVYHQSKAEAAEIFSAYGIDPDQHLFAADLTDEKDVERLSTQIMEKAGKPWAVVNIAGGSTNGVSWKLTLDNFRAVVDQNLTSTFLVNRAFIPHFRDEAAGRIVSISSVVAGMGVAGASHYAASKGAIESYTRSVALELAPKNITVNAIALGYFEFGLIDHVPGTIQDEIKSKIPLKRFGKANEVGSLIAYLLSEDAGYLTGQVFHLNGGLFG